MASGNRLPYARRALTRACLYLRITVLDLNPADRVRADHTILQLNLNSPFLVVKRQAWWDELDQLHLGHRRKDWSLVHLRALDLLPQNKKLTQFFSMTRQFFGHVAEQVLQGNADAI